MIIWGSGGDSANLGKVETRHCSTCEKDRPFNLVLNYRYAHVYYLKWVTKKQYFLACDACNRGWELNTKTVEATMEKSPIPFMHRFGWLFLVVPIVLLLITGALSRSH